MFEQVIIMKIMQLLGISKSTSNINRFLSVFFDGLIFICYNDNFLDERSNIDPLLKHCRQYLQKRFLSLCFVLFYMNLMKLFINIYIYI